MSKELDERLKGLLASELDTVEMTRESERRVLAGIHQQIEERSNTMRISKGKMVVAIAAAIAVTATITAVAAGKIVALVSGITEDETVYSAAELEEKAGKSLDTKVYIAEALSDGFGFLEGSASEVVGMDEAGNTVASYPSVRARYGADGAITLSIEKPPVGIPEDPQENQIEETYNGKTLRATEDQYLFLPPDMEPSEEDRKLEEEGKLYISYGSSEIEREVFKHISWDVDGIKYSLYTFGDQSLENLLGMAKGYIDGMQ